MHRYTLALILSAVCGAASAQPIKDVEQFQATAEKCIMGKAPNLCLDKLLSTHFLPGNEDVVKTLPQIASFLVQWLNGDTVYAIHPIKTKKIGNILERRIYLIESEQGMLMVLEEEFLKTHGENYLFKFNFSSTSETIEALFQDKL